MKQLDTIPGVKRIEQFSRDEMAELCMEETRSVYSHQSVFGTYCTIEEYIDCPPEKVFEYLSDPLSLQEWTWSTRDFEPTDEPGLLRGYDRLADNTPIHCRTESNAQAGTVDYHCAWDQGSHLWMIYLMRIVPAQLVFNRPGSVVIWSNCKHPFYGENPFRKPRPRSEMFGWEICGPFSGPGTWWRWIISAILEHRHQTGEVIRPWAVNPAESIQNAA